MLRSVCLQSLEISWRMKVRTLQLVSRDETMLTRVSLTSSMTILSCSKMYFVIFVQTISLSILTLSLSHSTLRNIAHYSKRHVTFKFRNSRSGFSRKSSWKPSRWIIVRILSMIQSSRTFCSIALKSSQLISKSIFRLLLKQEKSTSARVLFRSTEITQIDATSNVTKSHMTQSANLTMSRISKFSSSNNMWR